MPSLSSDIQSEESLGYDFEDEQTRAQLELVDDLQKLGVSKYIDLPQLVVVGDQSTGKSSVLQAVTEIPFAIDDRMCTRFATEIVLRRTSGDTTSIDISIEPSPDETLERKAALKSWKPKDFPADGILTKTAMRSIFSEAEDIIFGPEVSTVNKPKKMGQLKEYAFHFEMPNNGTSISSREIFGNQSISPTPSTNNGNQLSYSNIRSDGPSIFNYGTNGTPPTGGLFTFPNTNSGNQNRQNRLSSSTLRITRSGPRETNFAIVDVPGLVRGKDSNEEYRTAKALVQKYLENPKSIVVVVIDIVDTERQEIFQMLDHLPDEESRVIGVINKCDTKQKKSHDFVFDLIQNERSRSPKYLKEGWYGLRNRQAAEQDVSDEVRDQTERNFFTSEEWKTLDQSKLGRDQLKKALVRMRNRHLGPGWPISQSI